MNRSARARAAALVYGVSLACLVAAVLLRWLLDPVLGDTLPLVTLFGAIAVAVWIGGYRPALVVVALGYLVCAYLFIPPRGHYGLNEPVNFIGLFLYLATSSIIIGFGEALRRAQQRYRLGEESARQQAELMRTTLVSIGDGVITTDPGGCVTSMNAVAEALTGWTSSEGVGQPLEALFHIVNETTRQTVENPALRALREGVVVGLANHTVLIAKDGTERPIDDSAAPIRRNDGKVVGCVLVFRDISERHRAEAEHREARQQIATTLESVTDGFIRYDRDWRIVYVNAEAERINKLTRSEMLGKTPWELFPAVVGTKLEAEFRRAVAERVTVEFENHYEPFGCWYSLKGYPTADGGLTTFIRDITEQKRFEQRLVESEARYRAIGESIDYGVWVCDATGRNTYASESFLRLVGMTQQQCSDFGWGDVLHPDDAAATIEAWKECVQTQGRWDRVHRFKGVDGRWHHVLARGVPLRDATGQILGWAGLNLDISRMREAEQEIVRIAAESERQRRLYETVLTNTPDLAYVFDLSHRFTYANHALLTMWGLAWDDAIGKNCHELGYEPWHAAMHDREIEQVVATKQPIRGEVAFDGTNGRRQYDYIFVPVIGADGEVEAVAGTTRDVTERKLAEVEREQLVSQLRDQDRRKDEFLATLAHELRNPLAPIRNGLQVMRLARANGTIEQARTIMERQLTQLIRLVDDLLDVSRVTSGKLELRRERVELKSVINAAVEASRPALEQAGHELAVIVPDEPIHLDGDSTRLAQVVSNLLNNSAKYTNRDGHVRLSVGRENGMAVVLVADNGIGIPPDMLGKVFDMFTQVDRTLEKTTGGLGIGLSLAKGLVEMHGGTIEARSEGEGRGSEFIVRLPLGVSVVQGVEPLETDEAVGLTVRRRILVADDNVDSAASLGQLLELLGNDVSTAHDGLEAMDVAERFRPDVIFLDIGMPKLNGYEACRRIREQPWGKNAILFALTGWGQDEDKRRSQEAGFNHHLVKPVDPVVLQKLLASLKSETA